MDDFTGQPHLVQKCIDLGSPNVTNWLFPPGLAVVPSFPESVGTATQPFGTGAEAGNATPGIPAATPA